MRILGYHISGKIVVNSDGSVCSSSPYLDFLLEPKPRTIRMLYNLDYSISALSELLLLDYEKLLNETKLSKSSYNLRYVRGKFFSIKRPGAFSYYTNADQYISYPNKDLLLPPLVLATRAKEVGDRVYKVLRELGLEVTSLTSPARAYEKTQLKWLYNERCKASGDKVKLGIIDGIGSDIFGNRWNKYLEGALMARNTGG